LSPPLPTAGGGKPENFNKKLLTLYRLRTLASESLDRYFLPPTSRSSSSGNSYRSLIFTIVSLAKSYSNLLSCSCSTGGKSSKSTPFFAS